MVHNLNHGSLLNYFKIISLILLFSVVEGSNGGDSVVLSQYDLITLIKQPESKSQSILLIDQTRILEPKIIQLPNITSSNCNHTESLSYDKIIPGRISDDVLYFSTGKFIGIINLEYQFSGILYCGEPTSTSTSTTKKQIISDLKHNKNDDKIYFIENNELIKSLDLQTNLTTQILKESNKITSISMNDNLIYYTILNSRVNSSIKSYDINTKVTELVSSNLMLPTSIDYHDNNLYFVSNPPGIYSYVQKINIHENGSNNALIVSKESNHHGSIVLSNCHGLYWLDFSGRFYKILNGGGSRIIKFSSEDEDLRFDFVSKFDKNCDGIENLVDDEDLNLVNKKESVSLVKENDLKRIKSSKLIDHENRSEKTYVDNLRLCSDSEVRIFDCYENGSICVFIGGLPACLSRSTKTTNQSQTSTTNLPQSIIIIISILSTTTAILFLIATYNCVRVRKLSRKPIIRRRLVVSRRTSENNQHQQPSSSSVCEMIDIENCCGGNVCETPCYERTLLHATTTSPQTPNNQVNSTNTGWVSSKDNDKRLLLNI